MSCGLYFFWEIAQFLKVPSAQQKQNQISLEENILNPVVTEFPQMHVQLTIKKIIKHSRNTPP